MITKKGGLIYHFCCSKLGIYIECSFTMSQKLEHVCAGPLCTRTQMSLLFRVNTRMKHK
jgi:hypothetical protein